MVCETWLELQYSVWMVMWCVEEGRSTVKGGSKEVRENLRERERERERELTHHQLTILSYQLVHQCLPQEPAPSLKISQTQTYPTAKFNLKASTISYVGILEITI